MDLVRKKGNVTLCPICGILYTVGDTNDMAMHRRYHERFLDGIPASRINKKDSFEMNGQTIIYVNEKSKQSLKHLVEKAIERAADDLGDAPPLPSQWKCYLMQIKNSIVGFVLIENDVDAYLESNPEKKVKCKLGVLRMWVVAKHRRNGVATTLVDAARHNESSVVAKCAVAFSEPTEAGYAFAHKYCGVEPFVFDIVLCV